jgi:hypothetical protein
MLPVAQLGLRPAQPKRRSLQVQELKGEQERSSAYGTTFLVLVGSPAQPRSPGVGEVHSVVESARLRGCAATLGMPARA